MPYLLLSLGLLLSFYALYRFLRKASVQEMTVFFTAAVILTLLTALFYMAVTGRLTAALALLAAGLPFARIFYSALKRTRHGAAAKEDRSPAQDAGDQPGAYDHQGQRSGHDAQAGHQEENFKGGTARQEAGRTRSRHRSGKKPDQMSRTEALDILGLEEPASEEDVQRAYRSLIKKLHPDVSGSKGLTLALNRAREVLLDTEGSDK